MDINKTHQQTCDNTTHNPSIRSTQLGRFLDFLLFMNKRHFRKDGTAICFACGTPLTAPRAFYSPWIKALYYLLAAAVGCGCGLYIAAFMETVRPDKWGRLEWGFVLEGTLLVAAVCLFLIARIVSACIFTWGLWEEDTSGDAMIEKRWDATKKNRILKFQCLFFGFILAFRACIIM